MIGPGLGVDDWAKHLWNSLQKWLTSDTSRATVPIVVDADGLRMLAQHPLASNATILTPHPGEAASLLDIKSQQVQAERFEHVHKLAERYQSVAVLKGNGSLIATSSAMALCSNGNPGMATAGMGDVLAGITGACVVQPGYEPYRAVCEAVCLHASAADLAAKNGVHGLLASDVIAHIPEVLQ